MPISTESLSRSLLHHGESNEYIAGTVIDTSARPAVSWRGAQSLSTLVGGGCGEHRGSQLPRNFTLIGEMSSPEAAVHVAAVEVQTAIPFEPLDIGPKVIDVKEAQDIEKYYISKEGRFAKTNDEADTCDACMFCFDTCCSSACATCAAKSAREAEIISVGSGRRSRKMRGSNPLQQQGQGRRITACQLKRHRTIGSPWLVMDGKVIDCSDYIMRHPGGMQSILRHAGNVESCRQDFDMHPPAARRLWMQKSIGRLVDCPGHHCCSSTAMNAGPGKGPEGEPDPGLIYSSSDGTEDDGSAAASCAVS